MRKRRQSFRNNRFKDMERKVSNVDENDEENRELYTNYSTSA